MNIRNDENITQILDKYSENFTENPSNNADLSGWSEEFPEQYWRKGLLSAGSTRIKTYLNNTNPFLTKSKNPEKKAKNSKKFRNFSSEPQTDKEIQVDQKFCLSRRFKNDYLEESGSKQSSTFHMPTLRLKSHQKRVAINYEKKKVKLEDYYNKTFFISQKSPPIISGYSVTLYHK